MSEKSPKNIKNTCKTNIYKFRANSKKAQQVNPSPFKSARVPWTYFFQNCLKYFLVHFMFSLLSVTLILHSIYPGTCVHDSKFSGESRTVHIFSCERFGRYLWSWRSSFVAYSPITCNSLFKMLVFMVIDCLAVSQLT